MFGQLVWGQGEGQALEKGKEEVWEKEEQAWEEWCGGERLGQGKMVWETKFGEGWEKLTWEKEERV